VRIARLEHAGHRQWGEIDDHQFHPLVGDLCGDLRRDGPARALSGVPFLAPLDPAAVITTLRSFPPVPSPDEPLIFAPKLLRAVGGEGVAISIPPDIGAVYAEAELAVVLAQRIDRCAADEITDAMCVGFTCLNDVSAIDLLRSGTSDMLTIKSFLTFAPLGPHITTDMSLDDGDRGITIVLRVNGEVRATSNTADLRMPLREIISAASHVSILEPGTVLSFGTPSPVPIAPGDDVEVDIDGIGVLHNPVAAATDLA
jgi:2-keto-4-pentenoate hydratase/2-oxohepta-3-ene-1,7-dioic acid hydratase in catechol pathway